MIKKILILINNLFKMRNKEVVQTKLERLEAEVKLIGYNLHRGERDLAFDKVATILEAIGDIRTLLNTESQD